MHLRCCSVAATILGVLLCDSLAAELGDWCDKLSQGYASSTKQPLLDFLDDWHARSKPVTSDTLKKKPAFERAVYGLYQAFFKPAEEYYRHTRYVVVQDKIDVRIVDSDLRRVFEAKTYDRESLVERIPEISRFVCHDFRPEVKPEGKRVLYLDDERLAVMLAFLTKEEIYHGKQLVHRYWDLDCQSDERRKRLRYLNTAMKVIPGHWGTGWHFETHPQIDKACFSSDLKRAIVFYHVYYDGGEALMQRQDNGDWKMVLMEDTWVE